MAGRHMTGFCDEEEAAFGKRRAAQFPFALEARLRELGAQWQEAPLMMPKVVVDGRLVTGQNPFSTWAWPRPSCAHWAARRWPCRLFREDASLALVERWWSAGGALVERWLAGERAPVLAALRDDGAPYKPDLIAMPGYCQFKAAAGAEQQRRALAVMELGEPHLPHPRLRLRMAMAEAHIALDNPAAARTLLTAVLAAVLAGKIEKDQYDAATRLLQGLPY